MRHYIDVHGLAYDALLSRTTRWLDLLAGKQGWGADTAADRAECIRGIAKEILKTGEVVECHGPTKGELARFRREDYEARVRKLEEAKKERAAAKPKTKGWFGR